MKMIDDMVDSYVLTKYQEKANSLGVSSRMLIGRSANDGISPLMLVKSSSNRQQFEDLVDAELTINKNTDFYHFSLLMGKYFGVYNLYTYMFVVPKMREEIMRRKPNLSKTIAFFNKYNDNIFGYVEEMYGFSRDEYNEVLKNMFRRRDDYGLYNSPIVQDIGKTLMGCSLLESENGLGLFIRSGEAIRYFEQKNRLDVNKNVK